MVRIEPLPGWKERCLQYLSGEGGTKIAYRLEALSEIPLIRVRGVS